MKWFEELSADEQAVVKPWLWAFSKAGPNAVPLWTMVTPFLFNPLIIYIFLDWLDAEQSQTLAGQLQDVALYSIISMAAGFLILPVVPFVKRHIYGSSKGSHLPRISIGKESLIKGGLMMVSHLSSSAVTAVLFLGFSGRGWSLDPTLLWRNALILSLVSLPALLPGAVFLFAKIKLVSASRARKRRELVV